MYWMSDVFEVLWSRSLPAAEVCIRRTPPGERLISFKCLVDRLILTLLLSDTVVGRVSISPT